ncbi:transmembrane protein 163 isoform X3 [Lagopus muta]|uniref:transmembrane protein 163 isoform X3 n=1 Tax=Lagopus muta TaxID=64668 RepID=UPI00209E4187|nr:transmembrane protein 163 isoform X3 [Lagopus muta]
MEPPAAALDSTPDPAIVQPPGSSPPVPAREQQQEQLRIGESGRFGEGPEDRAVSVMRYSASSFGFAFDATLDVLSSAIVLWRYSNAAAVHSAHREYIACVILGVIFLLSSICIVIKAIHDLAKRVLPEVDDFLYSVSVLSGILCTVLAVIKFMLGKVLTSRALITDGCLLIWCPAYGKRATMKCLSEDHTPLLCWLSQHRATILLLFITGGLKIADSPLQRLKLDCVSWWYLSLCWRWMMTDTSHVTPRKMEAQHSPRQRRYFISLFSTRMSCTAIVPVFIRWTFKHHVPPQNPFFMHKSLIPYAYA